MVLINVQLSNPGVYLPPVFKVPERFSPPHTIIWPFVETAVCLSLPVGALVVEVVVQLSVSGLYLAPLFT